jgi:hypothetical protein
VLLVVDALALVILATLDVRLFAGTDMAIRGGVGFVAVDPRLAAFQVPGFLVRQRSVVDAVGDALLLIRVALYVGLQPLRRD